MTTITESFNISDGATIGPDQTWTKVSGAAGWNIASNRLRNSTGSGSVDSIRCEGVVSTVDHETEIVIPAGATDTLFYACVRFSASAETFYAYLWRPSDGVNQIIWMNAGSATVLVTGTGTTASYPVTIKLSVVGSELKGYVNGVEKATVTDTNITTGVRGGIAVRTQSASTADYDSFSVADVSSGSSVTLAGSAFSSGQGSLSKVLSIQL